MNTEEYAVSVIVVSYNPIWERLIGILRSINYWITIFYVTG